MADADLSATLAGIKENNERVIALCGLAPAVVRQLAEYDVPRLLKALEAVLKLHRPVDRGRLLPCCEGCEEVDGNAHGCREWRCPTVKAIAAALTGKDAGDE